MLSGFSRGHCCACFCHRASLRKKCLLGTNSVCNCKEILVFARSAARLNTRQQRPAKQGAQHHLKGDRADATREEPCTAEVSTHTCTACNVTVCINTHGNKYSWKHASQHQGKMFYSRKYSCDIFPVSLTSKN